MLVERLKEVLSLHGLQIKREKRDVVARMFTTMENDVHVVKSLKSQRNSKE